MATKTTTFTKANESLSSLSSETVTSIIEKLNALIEKCMAKEETTAHKVAILYTYQQMFKGKTSISNLGMLFNMCSAYNSATDSTKKIALSYRLCHQKYEVLKTKIKEQEEGCSIGYAGIDNGLRVSVRRYNFMLAPGKDGKNHLTSLQPGASHCSAITADLYSGVDSATIDYLEKLGVTRWNLDKKVAWYIDKLISALRNALNV